jgi:putative membrane protein
MARLSEADRTRIRDAVVAAERQTSAEFVTVIARRADGYLFAPTLVAALVALLGAGIALMIRPELPARDVFAGQVAIFAVLSAVLRLPPLLMAIVPRPIRQRRARRMARELFLDLGLLDTQARTGVLLFVALGERHIEIIADRGVSAHIDDPAWQAIVDRFVADVRRGAAADAFVTAIGACGELLQKVLPAAPDDRDELPDGLVEL